MIVAAACLSHTPYLDRARAEPRVEARFYEAVDEVAAEMSEARPDVLIAFHPDHYNGVFYDLMPPFCVAAAAVSIGDFGTVAGALRVDTALSTSLVDHCLRNGFDMALAHALKVDHGLAQPLEMVAAELPSLVILPVFVNCAAEPRPSFRRCRELGALVGRWAHALSQRVALLGSGGLSHDPPIASLATASGDVRDALIAGRDPSHGTRLARQRRVFATGRAFAAGEATIRQLNPDWDRRVLNHLARGELAFADDWEDEDALTEEAGCGAHELRTWIAALSALATASDVPVRELFYHPILEWITGTAVVSTSLGSTGLGGRAG